MQNEQPSPEKESSLSKLKQVTENVRQSVEERTKEGPDSWLGNIGNDIFALELFIGIASRDKEFEEKVQAQLEQRLADIKETYKSIRDSHEHDEEMENIPVESREKLYAEIENLLEA